MEKSTYKRKVILRESKTLADCAIITLVVWENKNSYYAKLYRNSNEIASASFYEKDGDMSIYRVKEYFNF